MNLSAWQTLLVALATSGGSVLVGHFALRGNRAAAAVITTTDIINQLQEERDSLVQRMEGQLAAQREEYTAQVIALRNEHAAQMAEMKAEHAAQMAEVRTERDTARHERDVERSAYVTDRRILFDYIEKLRRQISEEAAPPPLPWPDGLSR